MKTIFIMVLLFLSGGIFAQEKKKQTSVEESRRAADYKSVPSCEKRNTYFKQGRDKDYTILLMCRHAITKTTKVSSGNFSSPNDVEIFTNSSGGQYWKSIDGTVVNIIKK